MSRGRERERESIDFKEVDSFLEKVNQLQRSLFTHAHTHTHTERERKKKSIDFKGVC